MNLSAYDTIDSIKKKTRVYNNRTLYPYIITREVKYRPYYCYVKRYSPALDCNVYFLVLLDDRPGDRKVYHTRLDSYGRIKLSLATLLKEFNNNIINDVSIKLDTHTDDGDIYILDMDFA